MEEFSYPKPGPTLNVTVMVNDWPMHVNGGGYCGCFDIMSESENAVAFSV